jgi:pyruvate,orthophosphate dikinase
VVDEYMHPVLDKGEGQQALTKGLPASPGSAVGQAVFFAEHAVELASQGIRTILIRHETSPEDIDGLKVAEGIITAHGGLTSHAAVVARGMGKCCVVGAGDIAINYLINEMTVRDTVVKRLDWVSMDGNTGEMFVGRLPQVQPALEGGIAKVLEWADRYRRLGVYANADTAEDARHAIEQGAGGIGLCRTEHMFFDINRIPLFRKMILAIDEVGRSAALAELLPLQRKDFMDIFRVMHGKPVTIRLLDPPLNEFLPKGIRSQTRMARAMGISVEMIQRRTEALSENNPMMGHRGCRLAVTYPEIYNMQVRAIVEAACIVKKEGVEVHPEIMVPLVSTTRELVMLRRQIEVLVQQVTVELGESIPFKIGTMVETPRAAVCSRGIARYADFYSFGTNDLTQMTFGFSRDDVGVFLPIYLEKGILDTDPFMELDQEGTGRLVQIATEEGRKINPKLKLGICGEHGGDPRSVKFFHRVGLDYVSCSPFRVPVARLAAGQAAVEEAVVEEAAA